VTAELSFTHLILQASWIVQLVMLLLLLISLASWTVIFRKRLGLSQARRDADEFEDDFWSGIDLAALYTRISRREDAATGLEAIFLAGFQEFLRLRAQPTVDPESVVAGSQRAMRAALSRETDELEAYLPVLATAASVSPYIGLFGTVWGIMTAFMGLGAAKTATLQQVAPGIAEALVATAMGLFAAIPAVVAYNRYAAEVDRLVNRFDTFAEEFSNILQRQAHSLRAARQQQAETHGAA